MVLLASSPFLFKCTNLPHRGTVRIILSMGLVTKDIVSDWLLLLIHLLYRWKIKSFPQETKPRMGSLICLVCCSPWGHKESDMTEQLNWTELVSTPKHNTLLFPHEAISWGERPRVEAARFCNQSFKWSKDRQGASMISYWNLCFDFPSQKQCLRSQFLEEVFPYGILGTLSQTKPSWRWSEHSLYFLVPVLQIWQTEGVRDFKAMETLNLTEVARKCCLV